MAVCNIVYFVFALFLATSCAAPTDDAVTLFKIPSECRDQSFCDIKPEGYDLFEEKINSVLPEFLIQELDNRDGEAVEPKLSPKDDWHNCPYETKRQSMYIYNHGQNNTKIEIIVQTKLLRQYVDIVTCATQHIDTGSNEQCFQDLGVSDFHMKSSCLTTTAKRTLYVFDPESAKILQKSFEVPACCTCKVSYL